MRKALTCSANVQRALQPFTDALSAAPHRDVTFVPYSQWLRLYIDILRTARQQDAAAGAIMADVTSPSRSAKSTDVDPEYGSSDAASAGAKMLRHVKASIDASMWSSLVSHRWGEVLLPSESALSLAQAMHVGVKEGGARSDSNNVEPVKNANPTASCAWYLAGPSSSIVGPAYPFMRGLALCYATHGNEEDTRQHEVHEAVEREPDLLMGSAAEIVSPSHLVEPLLGGASLAAWMGELRRAAAARAAGADEASQQHYHHHTHKARLALQRNRPPTFYVCIPFSTWFELKQQAHIHPTRSPTHSGSGGSSATVLSLQERRARQTLLQSLNQLLQVQADLEYGDVATPTHTRAAEKGVSSESPLLQVQVMSATQEFDAICDLLQVRPLLARLAQTAAAPQVEHAALSLGALCEAVLPRIVYFIRHAALPSQMATIKRSGQQRGEDTGDEDRMVGTCPVSLLTHASNLRTARLLGSSLTREQSTFPLWRRRMQEVGDTRATRGSAALGERHIAGTAAYSHVTHQQARRGCGDMIRRMTNREENLRQSLSQR